jgi:hypothetical protein
VQIYKEKNKKNKKSHKKAFLFLKWYKKKIEEYLS